jgi:Dockerin type I domain
MKRIAILFGLLFITAVFILIPDNNVFAADGDLDGNGCIDRSDLSIILSHIRSPEEPDPSYDLNGDGSVNIADARYLVTLFTNPRGAPCQ